MPGLLCCCCFCLRCCLPPSSMSSKSARAGARGRVGSRVGERLDMCGRSQAMCPGPNRIGAVRISTATAMVGLVGEATRALSLHRLASPCRRQGDGKHQLTSSENQRPSLATSAPPRGARLSPLRRQKLVAGRPLRTCFMLLGRTMGCVRQMRKLPTQLCARSLSGQTQISLDSHGFDGCWQLSSSLCLFLFRRTKAKHSLLS